MKNKYAIVAIVILALIAGYSFVSYNSTPIQKENLKIGAVLHLTGALSEAAEAFRDGMVIAADEINEAGGVNNKQIKLLIEDDQYNPTNSATAAQKLINIDKVDAATDAAFFQAQANGKLFEDGKTSVIVLWDANPQIDAMGDYVFAIGPWTPSAGQASADFSYNELSAKKAVIIEINEPWSVEVSNIFKSVFESHEGKVVDRFSINLNQANDFRTVITRSIADNPDIIYAPISEGMSIFYVQLKELGYKGKIITSDIITDNVIQNSKGATENVYQTQILDPEGARTEHMIDLYRKKFGRDPKNVLYNAWGYDAVHLIAEAAKNCLGDGEAFRICIKDNLYKIKDFDGASAKISINENGSSPMPESVFQIRNGTFVLVKK